MLTDTLIEVLRWLPVVGCVLLLIYRKRLQRRGIARADKSDPMKDAAVLIAYGRTQQAIELLEAGLKRWPDRTDIVQKLAHLKGQQ